MLFTRQNPSKSSGILGSMPHAVDASVLKWLLQLLQVGHPGR
jgi:hypothetical protein